MKISNDAPLARFLFTLFVLFNLVACGEGENNSSDNEGQVEPVTTGECNGSYIETPVDSGFTLPNQGLSGEVWSVVPAGDGSEDIYVGGAFTSYNGCASNHIMRLNSDGTVDNGFAVGSGFNGLVSTIIPAPDDSGDIYVGGGFTNYNGTTSNYIIRLNSDGTVDSSFVVGTGFNSYVTSIVPAPDSSGDIYVGGAFTLYHGTASRRIIRLNSDGTVDSSFVVGAGFSSIVRTIAPLTDGSGDIYVGGEYSSYNSTNSPYIIRLNNDGSVDSSFTVGAGFDSNVRTVAFAPDGSGDIYVGGFFSSYDGTLSNRLIRLNGDGTVDSSFAVGSGFSNDDDSITPVMTIVPSADGSGDIYVGGEFNSYNGADSNNIIRLNSDGSVDSSFSVSSGFDHGILTITPITDGSGIVYVGGYFTDYNGTPGSYIIRLSGNGAVSNTYAKNVAFNDLVTVITPATDGSGDVYVGGLFTSYDSTLCSLITRINSDGTIDSNFAVGSGFHGDFYPTVTTIVPASDSSGDIYVGGVFSSYNGTNSTNIIRLNSDGTVDSNFSVGAGFGGAVFTIVPAADDSGDIYVGGIFSSYNGTTSPYIIRLKSDGVVDNSFDAGSGFNGSVLSITPTSDGSGDIYVGGLFSKYNGSTTSYGITRLNSDGTVDSDFNLGFGFDGGVYSIVQNIDGSGDIYVGGDFTSYNGSASNGMIRLNSDGTVDSSFDIGSGFNAMVRTINLASDGSGNVYVGGGFTSYNGSAINSMIRLKSNGTVDSGFVTGASFSAPYIGTQAYIFTIKSATDGSGNIYVGGDFRGYQSMTAMGIISLSPDGSIY